MPASGRPWSRKRAAFKAERQRTNASRWLCNGKRGPIDYATLREPSSFSVDHVTPTSLGGGPMDDVRKRDWKVFMSDDDFERIVESAPELGGLGAVAPDGFMVLIAADGSRCSISRIAFMEHTNAVADVLRDPGADPSGVLESVAGLEPLARRVVLGTAYQHFKDWLLDRCPVESVPFALVHIPLFVAHYRRLTAGAPEYSGDYVIEDGSGA